MDEHGLRERLCEVKAGRLSRRRFVETMLTLGLTAPMAAQMLASAGVAAAQPAVPAPPPMRRGGSGSVTPGAHEPRPRTGPDLHAPRIR